MCVMTIPSQPTGCVSVSMHVCVYVCVCQAQTAQDVGNRQAATTNVSFFLFFSLFFFCILNTLYSRERERERKGRVNVDKLGACLWLDGREVGEERLTQANLTQKSQRRRSKSLAGGKGGGEYEVR